MSDTNNPFAGLIGGSEAEVKPTNTTSYDDSNNTLQTDTNKTPRNEDAITINDIVENVFHFTINLNAVDKLVASDKQLVYLEELAEAMKPQMYIDLEGLEQALFERLLVTDADMCVLPKSSTVYKEHVVQKQVFPYLFCSIQNLQSYEGSSVPLIKEAVQRMKELIFRNAVTALRQPDLFEGQYFAVQLVELLEHVDPLSHTFFIDVVDAFVANEDAQDHLKQAMVPVLQRIHADVNKSTIISLPIYVLPSIKLFASHPHLAPILMETCEPKNENNGRLYEHSVIGALLCLSVLPKVPSVEEFFDNPMDEAATSMVETSIWNASSHLTNNLHKIFLALLKGGTQMKNRLLMWIGKCLSSNAARGKLWNVQSDEMNVASLTCVSDGFMLNLGAVLLHLCQPFCSLSNELKILKIDPTYGAVPPDACEEKSVHLRCLYNETCLLPADEDDDGAPVARPVAITYSFVTECFFMTQKCIDLGVRVCAEKLSNVSQELGRAERTLADLASPVLSAAASMPQLDPVRRRIRHLMIKLVSLRCALMEKTMLTNLMRLQASTCTWLVQVAIRSDSVPLPPPTSGPPPPTPPPLPSHAPGTFQPVVLPVPTPPPDTLRCIPEFVLENIVVLITTVRRSLEAGDNEAAVADMLYPALTLVLTFMGDATRTNNPHLRARLAECLEAMLPNHGEEQQQQPLNSIASFYREQLFKDHPYRFELVPCLLDVFVGIEITGQSVFENKFNYRRPMYLVMDYLWSCREHRAIFTQLAREAEANMDAVHPPLFLCFVNLLMNDAIFLLDDALGNMAQIRTMQTAFESGEWANLPPQEREQNLTNHSRIGMQARFDNILGRDTVRTLVRLTAHVPFVFCHPTLVYRIASMLNYFLLHLVGPNKKNFKVKDMKKYEFDPASTVLDICRMYVKLGTSAEFCSAVCDDGRSYSPQLFTLAEAVLIRIGGGALLSSLREVAAQVARFAEERQRDEELLANAPEDFLDPIMSTLMMDPVILPSSRTTVDRTTIARHLLSDQSDPFNRSPLSMDLVTSNTELKHRIHEWVKQQRDKVAQTTSTDV